MPWPKGKPAHNKRGPDPETYACNKCGVTKPISDYYWEHNRRTCKQCEVKPTREQVRTSSLKSYGLTLEDFTERLEKQSNRCACCGSTKTFAPKRADVFVVDHDHETGKVRGLLCHRCNRGIGLLGDTVEALQNAIDYLTRHEPQPL